MGNTLNIMDYSCLIGIYYIGISTENANFNKKNWSFNANTSGHAGTYKAPNVELEIRKSSHNEENEELKQEELKEGDDTTNNKSDLIDLNTMSAMQKDFNKLENKLSPRNKKGSNNGLRRRAFTA